MSIGRDGRKYSKNGKLIGRPKRIKGLPVVTGVLSEEDRLLKIAEINRLIEEHRVRLEEVKDSDPFWFFEPNKGELGMREKEFLRKYLEEDDIPQRVDGQVDVFRSKASTLGISGGNQSSKSTSGAILAYIYATGEVPDSLKGIFPEDELIKKGLSQIIAIRVVGVDHKTLLNTVLPTYQRWCPREYLKGGKWGESFSSEQKKRFLYRKGNIVATIEFMTNQQDVESFQGPPIDVVIYDEEPAQTIRKENLMRFVTAGKVKEIFCWTPTKGLTWTYDLFMEGVRTDSVELYKLCSVANRKANLTALDEIMKGIDNYEERKMRLLGEFISLSGLVYGRLFDAYIHVIEPFFEDLSESKKRDFLVLTGLDPHLVTPTPLVFALLDRENNVYIDRCWMKTADTDEIKQAWHEIVKENGYRTGWSVADKSSNSTIIAFGGRNIFRELSRGKNSIPALRTSEKYEGSIKAGVDDIKKRLKVDENTGRPRFFIVNRPENKMLIQSMRTLERDTYANEDESGPKDRIKEGKHHLHAAMRYLFQYPLSWYPEVQEVPSFEFADQEALY